MKPLKQLKELALDYDRKKNPNFPEYARSVRSYTDKTSNGLTKCIIDWLKFSGWQAERISVQGRYVDESKVVTDVIGRKMKIGSGKFIPSSMQKGSADISATIRGKSVKIEVKIGRDRQSQEQLEYQRQVEQAGGVYFIAVSFEDFLNKYNQLI